MLNELFRAKARTGEVKRPLNGFALSRLPGNSQKRDWADGSLHRRLRQSSAANDRQF
jgi:hypothetical protein